MWYCDCEWCNCDCLSLSRLKIDEHFIFLQLARHSLYCAVMMPMPIPYCQAHWLFDDRCFMCLMCACLSQTDWLRSTESLATFRSCCLAEGYLVLWWSNIVQRILWVIIVVVAFIIILRIHWPPWIASASQKVKYIKTAMSVNNSCQYGPVWYVWASMVCHNTNNVT